MIIVDASVALKWFAPLENDSSKARDILTRHINQDDNIFVPSLFYYELANAWSTKTDIAIETAEKNLTLLSEFSLHSESFNLEDYIEIMRLSKKHHISSYDAAYVTLALKLNCRFVTSDQKLVNKIKYPFIVLLQDFIY